MDFSWPACWSAKCNQCTGHSIQKHTADTALGSIKQNLQTHRNLEHCHYTGHRTCEHTRRSKPRTQYIGAHNTATAMDIAHVNTTDSHTRQHTEHIKQNGHLHVCRGWPHLKPKTNQSLALLVNTSRLKMECSFVNLWSQYYSSHFLFWHEVSLKTRQVN